VFTPTGGSAIAALTRDGAQPQRLTYTGVQLGGPGSIVGPGFRPAVAPTVQATVGAGLPAGTYQYAYTDVTATGETTPSPIAAVATGQIAAPSTALTPAVATGSGPAPGTYQYAVTFVVGSGETTIGPPSAGVTTSDIAGPTVAPTLSETASTNYGQFNVGEVISVPVTFLVGPGATTACPLSNHVTITWCGSANQWNGHRLDIRNIPSGPAGVTAKRVHFSRKNGS